MRFLELVFWCGSGAQHSKVHSTTSPQPLVGDEGSSVSLSPRTGHLKKQRRLASTAPEWRPSLGSISEDLIAQPRERVDNRNRKVKLEREVKRKNTAASKLHTSSQAARQLLSCLQLLAMGCISSKVIARTLSLHEERNKGTQRNKSNNGFPLLEDIIKSAQSSSDQYFDLVLHSRSFGSNAPSKLTINDETDSSETTVKMDMSTSVEEDNQQEKHKIVSDDQIEGSESFHLILPDHVLSSLVQENSSGVENKYELANAGFTSKAERSDEFLDPKIIKENKYDLNSKGDVGSRSFHTVEEYDDLVRKIMLSKSLWFTDKDDTCSSGTTIDQIEDGDSAIKDIMEAKTIAPSEKHDVSIEKGYKRKAIARRLESLKIPSLGNIYAPGTYVTPKFGCYSSSFMGAGSENNSCIFPELVSELEQSMQILEEEEENILKQMESNSEEKDGKIMDPQERDIHSCM